MQAQDLEDNLTESLEAFPVEVLRGIDYIEVRPKGVNKGAFIKHMLHYYEAKYLMSLSEAELDQFTSSLMMSSQRSSTRSATSTAIEDHSTSTTEQKSTNETTMTKSSGSGNNLLYNRVETPVAGRRESMNARDSFPTNFIYNSVNSIHSSKSNENLNKSLMETLKEMEKLSLENNDNIKKEKLALPDFIWCVGDDTTDESMYICRMTVLIAFRFKAVHQYSSETINSHRTICTVY